MHKYLVILLGLLLSTLLYASVPSTDSSAKILLQSQQLVLVLTPSWDAASGKLQRYQRDNSTQSWKKVGEPIAIVVGKQGMAWGVGWRRNRANGPLKKEGDGRTPVGVFKLGPVFGFDMQPSKEIKLNYVPIIESTLCVDDQQSQYYNQVFDSAEIIRKDWRSAETMRHVPQYRWGSVVQYNVEQPVAGAGSCIFLHIWRDPEHGTAGCIAMDEVKLRDVLAWFDPAQQPAMVLLPQPIYQDLRAEWDLPVSE